MLKTPNKATRKAIPKQVAVIKNSHTDEQLDQMEERWLAYKGPRLTLADVLAIEKAKQTHTA